MMTSTARPTALLLALALAGCGATAGRSATAADVPRAEFDELDRDHSQALDEGELVHLTQALYQHMDEDGDGRLAPEELERGLFRVWDRDASGRLTVDELDRAQVAWFPHDTDVQFAYWDTDASGDVDRDEHAAGMERARLLESYDADGDGQVTDAELNGALFSAWDVDGSRSIDALEWLF